MFSVFVVWQILFPPAIEESVDKKAKTEENENADDAGNNPDVGKDVDGEAAAGEEPNADLEGDKEKDKRVFEEITFSVSGDLFTSTLSNKNGGTFTKHVLSNYFGSYSSDATPLGRGKIKYSPSENVSLIFGENDGLSESSGVFCNPCIKKSGEIVSPDKVDVRYGETVINNGDTFKINDQDVLTFTMLSNGDTLGVHSVLFENLNYSIKNIYEFNKGGDYSVVWANGTRPAERYYWLDKTNSYGMYSQKDEDNDWEQGESLSSEGSEVEWAGTRNLFFASILVPYSKNLGTKIEHSPDRFSSVESVYKNEYNRPEGPLLYDTEIVFSENSKRLEFDTFLGPLDYSVVKDSKIKNLDDIMTLGAWLLRPISKFIINTVQFIHYYIPFAGYGLVLILFAFIVRLISGPLTKRSLQATQKMQKVQPLIKEIQDKYKSDPKKMQTKIMQTYKENNVNPLSGCLLMFLQWPIMIPPFILFRSTIELRGESFLWIKDLSQPDYLISLPFNIPLIGTNEGWTGVGILPILMGVTLYLTMKKTMANMEGQNKIMMYTMNGMFVILFNSFPAGLNLYYVVYNILNYLQQRTTSAENESPSFFSKIKGFIQKQKK